MPSLSGSSPRSRRAVRRNGADQAQASGTVTAAPAGPPPELTIDALGQKCPIPIIMLAERIREVPMRGLVEVLADDPAAATDLPAWCALKSHAFVSMTEQPAGWSFLVRRSY